MLGDLPIISEVEKLFFGLMVRFMWGRVKTQIFKIGRVGLLVVQLLAVVVDAVNSDLALQSQGVSGAAYDSLSVNWEQQR